jgi:hypothetical protein
MSDTLTPAVTVVPVATVAADLANVIARSRRVYRYWREQGLSPDDARHQVGSYNFKVLA